MGKAGKYSFIALGGIILLTAAAIVIVPYFINTDQFKPRIEQIVSEKSGYPLTIQGDIDIYVFPWIGFSLTDLKLDNPEGFQEKTFLTVKNFQARVKVLPLLSKKVEIHRFVIDQPEVLLTRNSSGVWNWQSNQPVQSEETAATNGDRSAPQNTPATTPAETSAKQLGIESLLVGECALRDGTVTVNDLLNKTTRKLSDINLTLQDVSLDKPIIITLLANLDGKPVDLKGRVGPITDSPFTSKIDLDVDVELFKTLAFNGSGHVENLSSAAAYQIAFDIAPFSPRKLFSALDLNLPAAAGREGPEPFESAAAQGTLSGTGTSITLSQAKITFDDSHLLAELSAREFSKPTLEFHLEMDSIDIDRYLPANRENGAEAGPDAGSQQPPAGKTGTTPESPAADVAAASRKSDTDTASGAAAPSPAPDFQALRNVSLKGDISIGTVLVHGGSISDLTVSVDGHDGLFNLASLKSTLYQGTLSSTGYADFRKAVPTSSINLDMEGVQAGPLLKDFADKDIIEGALNANIDVSGSGMTGDQLKASLKGTGRLLFQDGALIGVDLAQLARKITSGFTLEDQGERPKTDFAEFNAPFTINNGLVETKNTTLQSPFIRVNGHGTADLVSEALDFRLSPKLVGTIKGQGDQETRSGIAVPILVGGTFKNPTFAPDLKALVQEQGIDKEEISEILKTGKISPERKEQLSEEVEKAKTLLKGLFGN